MSNSASSTTLFNLKDEYLKAKKEVLTASDNLSGSSKRKKIQDIIRYKYDEKAKRAASKNARAEKRAAKIAMTAEEEESLRRSATILEAKSSIYEKLSIGSKSELPDNILVDFSQKKSLDKSIDINYSNSNIPSQSYYEGEVKEDMDEVYFSNIDNGEVRSKGVGFFAFSKDVNIRKQQMAFLNSMRESTEMSRKAFLASKQKQEKEKLNRLNRLRKKHNLSPLERLPGSKPETVNEGSDTENQDEISADERLQSDKSVTETLEDAFMKRQKTLWEERVEELRNERDAEFAPYYQGGVSNNVTDDIDEEELDEDSEAILNFIETVKARF